MPSVHANGLKLSYASTGDGPPLLLISGLGYGGNFWRLFTEEVSHAFRVITFDNRGVGGSEAPPGPYTTQQMAADAAGLLEALDVGEAFVLGHSLGGAIAQELALGFPARVRKLVLAATLGGPGGVPITPEALAAMTNRQGDPVQIFRRGVEVATAPGFPERNPERVAELLQMRLAAPVRPSSYSAQLAAGAGHDAWARLSAIACPTLVLTGTEDRVVPPANSELLAARIPHARVVRLEGLGHLLFVESPEESASAVLRFLNDV